MYKLLIVDDDILVRMDIRVLLNWEAMNIQLLEDAVNGMEALKQVEKFHPDILILDLGMPVMNGLEVIRRLKEMEYAGKIIVLSCHDDFDSVKEAMAMGATDYILKHLLKPECLAESIKNALKLLEKENQNRQKALRLKQLSEQSFTFLKDDLLKSLLEGNIRDQKELDQKLEPLSFELELTKFSTVLIEVDELSGLMTRYGHEQLTRLMISLRSIVEEAVERSKHCIAGCIGEGKFGIIMNFDSRRSYMSINSDIYSVCSTIQQNAQNILGLNVSAGISKIFTNLSAVSDCYSQARLALDGKLLIGKNRIIHFSEIENYKNSPGDLLQEYEQEIGDAIHLGAERIESCTRSVFSEIRRRNIKLEYVRLLGFELLAFANRMVKNFKLGYQEVFESEYLPYRYVMALETIQDMESWFTGICLNIAKELQHKADCSNEEIRPEIRKALSYIAQHYMKDITLQEIADNSNLSRTYFCQLFKQEMSVNFVDYLNRFRVEKAKALLQKSDLKVYEIGQACGFGNYRYFSRIFKEVTGASPGEYKEEELPE